MTTLKYDYKRTAVDLNGYELFQDLNDPKRLLLVKLTTVGNTTIETYYRTNVNSTSEATDEWNTRTEHDYLNLIDLFSENN